MRYWWPTSVCFMIFALQSAQADDGLDALKKLPPKEASDAYCRMTYNQETDIAANMADLVAMNYAELQINGKTPSSADIFAVRQEAYDKLKAARDNLPDDLKELSAAGLKGMSSKAIELIGAEEGPVGMIVAAGLSEMTGKVIDKWGSSVSKEDRFSNAQTMSYASDKLDWNDDMNARKVLTMKTIPEFLDAAKAWSAATGQKQVFPDRTLDQNIATNPKVWSLMAQNGAYQNTNRLVIQTGNLVQEVSKQGKDIHDLTQAALSFDGKLAALKGGLLQYFADKAKQEKARRDTLAYDQARVQAFQNASFMLGMVLKNKETARKLQVTTNSAVSLYSALTTFAGQKQLPFPGAQFFASINLAGSVLSISQGLLSGLKKPGPQPMAVISAQLRDLQESMIDLHNLCVTGFTQIDQKLTKSIDLSIEAFNKIEFTTQTTKNGVETLLSQMSTMQTELEALDARMIGYFQDNQRIDYHDLMDVNLSRYFRTRNISTLSEFSDAISKASNAATFDSKTSIWIGPAGRSTDVRDLNQSLSLLPVMANIDYLLRGVYPNFAGVSIVPSGTKVPNLQLYIEGAEDFCRLSAENPWPEYRREVQARVQGLVNDGDLLTGALGAVLDSTPGYTGRMVKSNRLLDSLLIAYTEQFKACTREIGFKESEYIASGAPTAGVTLWTGPDQSYSFKSEKQFPLGACGSNDAPQFSFPSGKIASIPSQVALAHALAGQGVNACYRDVRWELTNIYTENCDEFGCVVAIDVGRLVWTVDVRFGNAAPFASLSFRDPQEFQYFDRNANQYIRNPSSELQSNYIGGRRLGDLNAYSQSSPASPGGIAAARVVAESLLVVEQNKFYTFLARKIDEAGELNINLRILDGLRNAIYGFVDLATSTSIPDIVLELLTSRDLGLPTLDTYKSMYLSPPALPSTVNLKDSVASLGMAKASLLADALSQLVARGDLPNPRLLAVVATLKAMRGGAFADVSRDISPDMVKPLQWISPPESVLTAPRLVARFRVDGAIAKTLIRVGIIASDSVDSTIALVKRAPSDSSYAIDLPYSATVRICIIGILSQGDFTNDSLLAIVRTPPPPVPAPKLSVKPDSLVFDDTVHFEWLGKPGTVYSVSVSAVHVADTAFTTGGTSFTLPVLRDREYFVNIKARDTATGLESPVTAVTFKTYPDLPAAPEWKVVASDTGKISLKDSLAWKSSDRATEYELTIMSRNDTILARTLASTSYKLTGLRGGIPLTAYLRAKNARGYSSSLRLEFFVPPEDVSVMRIPKRLRSMRVIQHRGRLYTISGKSVTSIR